MKDHMILVFILYMMFPPLNFVIELYCLFIVDHLFFTASDQKYRRFNLWNHLICKSVRCLWQFIEISRAYVFGLTDRVNHEVQGPWRWQRLHWKNHQLLGRVRLTELFDGGIVLLEFFFHQKAEKGGKEGHRGEEIWSQCWDFSC